MILAGGPHGGPYQCRRWQVGLGGVPFSPQISTLSPLGDGGQKRYDLFHNAAPGPTVRVSAGAHGSDLSLRRSTVTWLNWPNRFTIARIMLVGPLVICLLNLNAGWAGWRYVSLGLVSLMAISDALDGFLARRLKEETPLGRFLDPVADKLLIICAVVLLAADSTSVVGFKLPNWVPVIAIGKDVLTVIGFVLVYLTTGRFLVQPRTWGKTCTLIQLVMVTYCLVAPDLAPWVPNTRLILSGLYWAASAAAVIALADYIRIGNRFAAEQAAAIKE